MRARTRWRENRDVLFPVTLFLILFVALGIIIYLAGR